MCTNLNLCSLKLKPDVKCVFDSHGFHLTVIVLCLCFNFLHHFAFAAYFHLNGCELLHYRRLMTFMCIAYFMEHLFPLLQLCDALEAIHSLHLTMAFVDRKMLIASTNQPPLIWVKELKKSNVQWVSRQSSHLPKCSWIMQCWV